MHHLKWLFIPIWLFIIHTPAFAQTHAIKLTPAIKAEVVDSLSAILIRKYIYLDTAVKMSTRIQQQLKSGGYNTLKNPDDFAQALNTDLNAVYRDLHMYIYYDPAFEKALRTKSYIESVSRRAQFLQQAKQKNFGFPEVKILDGNVGYVRINQFYDTNDQSLEVVNDVFSFLKNVNALIIDVRDNPGGEPDMVRYINSYFFNQRVHLNDFYDRHAVTNQYWTEPLPASAIFSTMPVYVLINGHTGSAAEEFAYDLQSLHRAAIIGQTTAGAAHWTTSNSISNGFVGNIPFRKAVNPVTHTNWEKAGVIPEILCNDGNAADVALLTAYDHLIAISTDSTLIKSLKWHRVALNAKLHPFKINAARQKSFAGTYSGRRITLTKEILYFTDTNGYHIGLIPASEDVFIFTKNDRRLEFKRNGAGRITGFDFIYPGGRVEKFNLKRFDNF